MNSAYSHPVLRQLRDQQVRFAPREKQLEQANRAERLLSEIEPAASTRTTTYASVSLIIGRHLLRT